MTINELVDEAKDMQAKEESSTGSRSSTAVLCRAYITFAPKWCTAELQSAVHPFSSLWIVLN